MSAVRHFVASGKRLHVLITYVLWRWFRGRQGKVEFFVKRKTYWRWERALVSYYWKCMLIIST